MKRLLLLCVLLLGACATTTESQAEPQVLYAPVHHLDGRKVHLSTFAQDQVVFATAPDGQPVTKVKPLNHLLLVVTHSECKWSRKLLSELASELPELRKLGVRTVGLLKEKPGHPIAEWSPLQKEDLTLLEDREGDCYRFYVNAKTPSISVIDAWGNLRLAAEGFVEATTLVERIRKKDFRPVPAGAG